jgi:hypothetical protein
MYVGIILPLRYLFFQLDKLNPRRRPWKIDYAGGSPESDIVVVINFLIGHVDDEETAGILALVVDEVLPRQCPCRRAFDRGSVLGIRRTQRRSINDEGHTNFTQVHVPSVEDRYILLAI